MFKIVSSFLCMSSIYGKIALIQALFHDMNAKLSPFDRTDTFLDIVIYVISKEQSPL